MAAEAKTRQRSREPEEDSVDGAARNLADLLDARTTGDWEALIASLPPPEPERPR